MIQTFSDYQSARMSQEPEVLEEALITLGGRTYPKHNTILILQGGAASGKDFILDKLIGIEGKVFDVDRLKELAVQSELLARKIKEETGTDIKNLNFKNPEDVGLLHGILNDMYQLKNKADQTFFNSVAQAHPDRKPNVIFNVTGKSLKHFDRVREFAENFGYRKEDVHVVWVLDDVKASIQKNLKRSRTVPEDILIETHQGASITSKKLLTMGRQISKYMDGDYWIVLNKMFVDSEVVRSREDRKGVALPSREQSKGHYIKRANYFRLKEQGDAPRPLDTIKEAFMEKVRRYVPSIDTW